MQARPEKTVRNARVILCKASCIERISNWRCYEYERNGITPVSNEPSHCRCVRRVRGILRYQSVMVPFGLFDRASSRWCSWDISVSALVVDRPKRISPWINGKTSEGKLQSFTLKDSSMALNFSLLGLSRSACLGSTIE